MLKRFVRGGFHCPDAVRCAPSSVSPATRPGRHAVPRRAGAADGDRRGARTQAGTADGGEHAAVERRHAVDLLSVAPSPTLRTCGMHPTSCCGGCSTPFRLTVTYDGCVRTPAQHGGMKADDARRLRGSGTRTAGPSGSWPTGAGDDALRTDSASRPDSDAG